jgi:hypothetical protein
MVLFDSQNPVCYNEILKLEVQTEKEAMMVITLGPELAAALNEAAMRQGVAPEVLAIHALGERFLGIASSLQPRDEWESGLLKAARDCGGSLPDSALSSEGLYD